MDGTRVRVRPVLADVGRINMFFALEAESPGPGWLSPAGTDGNETDGNGAGGNGTGGDGTGRDSGEGGSGDGGGALAAALAAEVDRVRERLAGPVELPDTRVEWRVAASIFHQGLATRLLSPVLAAGLCHRALLDVSEFHWDPRRKGPVVLRTCQEWAAPVTAGVGQVADWIEESVVTGVLARIARALAGSGSVAPGLLRGNTAAALAGAVRSLGEDRPAHRAEAEVLARTLLRRPALAGTGGYAGVDSTGAGMFRRTTCCLYYRLPNGGYCGDCALRP